MLEDNGGGGSLSTLRFQLRSALHKIENIDPALTLTILAAFLVDFVPVPIEIRVAIYAPLFTSVAHWYLEMAALKATAEALDEESNDSQRELGDLKRGVKAAEATLNRLRVYVKIGERLVGLKEDIREVARGPFWARWCAQALRDALAAAGIEFKRTAGQ
eukprot:tig00001017_g6253.t1